GGGRSGALVHVLRQVGWDAVKLDGGYKAFRRQVVAELEGMPARFRFGGVCGATGSGKSRLLEALAHARAHGLALGGRASHRGSVLGELPDAPQPSQQAFETALWTALGGFDRDRTVFVESESRKVGNLRVPDALIARMRASPCIRLEGGEAARVALLLEDYAHFVGDPGALAAKVECLRNLHGAGRIGHCKDHLRPGASNALVSDLLVNHYDPAYRKSLFRNYPGADDARVVEIADISRDGFLALARRLKRDIG